MKRPGIERRPPEHPAAMLKYIRDGGGCEDKSLLRYFGFNPRSTAPHHLEREARLRGFLGGLEAAGLVRAVGSHGAAGEEVRWEATQQVEAIQKALHLSLSVLSDDASGGETATRLHVLADELEHHLPADRLRVDMVASVREAARCYASGCHIAVMALCGKLLEICLKMFLLRSNVKVEDNWMLGTLIGRAKEAGYVDPALTNVANVINLSRIPAVHAKEDVPIPTAAQARMVIEATVDTLQRTLLGDGR